MNTTTTPLALAAIATAAAMLLAAPSTARADADDGVACPSYTEATQEAGVLRCKVTLQYTRASVCPPIGFANYTTIQIRGRDHCAPQFIAVSNKADVPSAMAPLPGAPRLANGNALPAALGFLAALAGPPISAYSRDVSQAGSDRFVAEKDFFLWPDRFPAQNQVGRDPARGVTCPAGFDEVSIANGRGLRCEDRVNKFARCDIGWRLEVDAGPNNRDLCQMGVGIGTITGNYTVPEGTTGAAGNPSQHGWSLAVRANGDLWSRTDYRHPVAR